MKTALVSCLRLLRSKIKSPAMLPWQIAQAVCFRATFHSISLSLRLKATLLQLWVHIASRFELKADDTESYLLDSDFKTDPKCSLQNTSLLTLSVCNQPIDEG